MKKKIAVVGGGAAGMTAAIRAAEAGAEVTLYERNDRTGKKILATGNGKCNFSNEKMGADCYFGTGAELVDSLYRIFGVQETKAFFDGLGMRIRDRNGYLYPASEQAATVADVLRYELERLGVRIHTCRRVTGLLRERNRFVLDTEDKNRERYEAVILAAGGQAAPKTGSDGGGFALAKKLGHRIIPAVPALCALRCKEDFYKQAAGVRCDAGLTLQVDGRAVRSERGELQWTDYGISGIPVFQLSRTAAYALKDGKKVSVKIDLMPDQNEAVREEGGETAFAGDCGGLRDGGYQQFWEKRWKRQKNQSMEQFVTGLVNKKIGLLLLKLAGIKGTEQAVNVPKERRRKLAELCRSLTVEVKAVNSFEQAQVSAGGVDCREVTQALESTIVPGLFFAGEILDIDGICGGYNLQWAWTSGTIAGCSAASSSFKM